MNSVQSPNQSKKNTPVKAPAQKGNPPRTITARSTKADRKQVQKVPNIRKATANSIPVVPKVTRKDRIASKNKVTNQQSAAKPKKPKGGNAGNKRSNPGSAASKQAFAAQVAIVKATILETRRPVIMLTCKDCLAAGKETVDFAFSSTSQLKFEQAGFDPPVRCQECREAYKARRAAMREIENDEKKQLKITATPVTTLAKTAIEQKEREVKVQPSFPSSPPPGPTKAKVSSEPPLQASSPLSGTRASSPPASVQQPPRTEPPPKNNGGGSDSGGGGGDEPRPANEVKNPEIKGAPPAPVPALDVKYQAGDLPRFEFHRLQYPPIAAVDVERPEAASHGVESAWIEFTNSVWANLGDLSDATGGLEFEYVYVPGDLLFNVQQSFGFIPHSPTRVITLKAAVRRLSNTFAKEHENSEDFWRTLRATGQEVNAKYTYFSHMTLALLYFVQHTEPRRVATTELADRIANINSDETNLYLQGYRTSNKLCKVVCGAALNQPFVVAGSGLCCVAATPSPVISTTLATVGAVTSSCVSALGAAVTSPWVLMALACFTMAGCGVELPQPTCPTLESTQGVVRGIKRRARASLDRFLRQADDAAEDQQDVEIQLIQPPAKRQRVVARRRANSAPAANVLQPRVMPPPEQAGDEKLHVPAARELDLKVDEPQRMVDEDWAHVLPQPEKVPDADESSSDDDEGQPLMGNQKSSPPSPGGNWLNGDRCVSEAKTSIQYFEWPPVAPSVTGRLRDAGEYIGSHSDTDVLYDLTKSTYSGNMLMTIPVREVGIAINQMTTQDIVEYRDAAGTYRESFYPRVLVNPAPYGNPDICPHFKGVECLKPLPDMREKGFKACIDPAFHKSWREKYKPQAQDKHSKNDWAQFENATAYPDIEPSLPSKQWFLTGICALDMPCAGYAATTNNTLHAMNRHYGAKPRSCECDPTPHLPWEDYTKVGTCRMCILWEEARHAVKFWSDDLPAQAMDYLNDVGKTRPPAPLHSYAELIALGSPIESCTAADDDFGVVSWYGGLKPAQRRVYGQGIYDLLDGKMGESFPYSMTMFIKWEKFSNVSPNGPNKRLKQPRAVCPSKDPKANLVSGPIFKGVSKALTQSGQRWLKDHTAHGLMTNNAERSDKTTTKTPVPPPKVPPCIVTSGMNQTQVGRVIGAWFEEGYTSVAELDFSRLDSTENKQFARIVYMLLAIIIFLVTLPFLWVAVDQLFLSMSHRLMYTPFGVFMYIWALCSGFGGTFQINSIGVLTAVVGRTWVNLRAQLMLANPGLDIGLCTDYIRFLGLGDDCLLAFKNVHPAMMAIVIKQTNEDLIAMGLNPTPVHSPVPSFCSALIWPVRTNGQETYVLGPEILRLISRFGATFSHKYPECTRAQGMAYSKGNVLSNVHWQGIPVLRILYAYYSKLDVQADFSQREYHRTYDVDTDAVYTLSVKTIHFMETAYGMNPEMTNMLESELHTALVASGGGPCMFSSPYLHIMALHFEKTRDTDVLSSWNTQ